MNDPIHVAIIRTVKPGCETEFERALHDFVGRSLLLSGQMGVDIIRPAPGSGSRQYGILRKFADRNALAEFRASPQYLEWNQIAVDLTEGGGKVEELCARFGKLVPQSCPVNRCFRLPQWKNGRRDVSRSLSAMDPVPTVIDARCDCFKIGILSRR